MAEIIIKNIGPIKHLSFPVPEGGGVVVLRGPNGCGKSHAITATARLLGSKGKPPILDGAQKGNVEGLGVKIIIGGRVTQRGELETTSIEGRLDLANLVDPGIADPVAANTRRVKSLVSLAGVSYTDEEISKKLGGLDLPGDMPDDLVDKIAKVKRHCESRARALEGVAEKCRSTADGLRLANKSVDVTAPSDADELNFELYRMIQAQANVEGKHAAAVGLNASITKATEDLETLEEADVDQAQRIIESAKDTLSRAFADLKAVTEMRSDANKQHVAAGADLKAAEQSLGHAKSIAAHRQALTDTICQVVEQPQDIEIQAAKDDRHDASNAVAFGAIVRKAIADEEVAQEKTSAAEISQRSADTMRDHARNAESILHAAVESLDTELRMKKGVLSMETDRGWEPFDELSHGERTKAAVSLGARFVGRGGVLACRQEFWEGLDSDGREAVNARAKALGVVVITAEADHEEMGELRAEEFRREHLAADEGTERVEQP